jgi:SNF2 family DNA or RNA helicase
MDAIADVLTEAGVSFVRVDGTTSADARITARDAFVRGDAQVFLGQVIATGIGMDGLQGRTVFTIMVDHPWRSDAYAQALARTARRGQTEPTHHVDLVANTLQLRILERLREGDLFDAQAQEWQALRRAIGTNSIDTPTEPT